MENPIIVALDNVGELAELRPLVEDLAPHVGMFKVGLELITRFGPRAVEFVQNLGGRVFYDGKFNDIPNTVGQATKAAVSLGVEMFNVHASSGKEAMRAAAAEKGKSKMLVVTVLTSLKAESLFDIGHLLPAILLEINPEIIRSRMDRLLKDYVPNLVREMATAAAQCGADGVVCSPLESEMLKTNTRTRGLLRVTPGIRPVWASANDQKRVMTPAEAVQAGANYQVIGRPITAAKDPVQAAQKILAEITEAVDMSEAVTEEI
jgi:orotidine-5'-phosphate decarboxylase